MNLLTGTLSSSALVSFCSASAVVSDIPLGGCSVGRPMYEVGGSIRVGDPASTFLCSSGRHGAFHTVEATMWTSAQSQFDKGRVCRRHTCSGGKRQRYRARMPKFRDQPCRVCWWWARSGFPPSNQAGLFVTVSTRSPGVKLAKILTKTWVWDCSGRSRCNLIGKETILVQLSVVMGLGLLVDRRKVVFWV